MSENHRTLINELMEAVVREKASDLHLSDGNVPAVRIDGTLVPLESEGSLSSDDMLSIAKALLGAERMETFLANKEYDFSHHFKDRTRFRCNAYFQQERIGMVMRLIPGHIRTLEELNLPPILKNFVEKKQGFFLTVGPVGQGKTTTLATMIEIINSERPEHIMTIEDPIEYMFEQKKSIIHQREIGVDTKDFHTALESAFRQDVDVIMVGEMRDLETISAAVTAGETGHLVFSTLHTNDAAQTIDRIIDSFPAEQQGQIRLQLAASLTGIFSIRLIPRISGGLVPAFELLINTPASANLIREGRTHEIPTVIETGSEFGMVNMNRSLADLVKRGEINPDDAFAYSSNPEALERIL